MRGAVTLAAALALPLRTATGEPLPERGLVIFLAFAVILVTLIGQGLTLGPLIRRLGVVDDGSLAHEELHARAVATDEVVQHGDIIVLAVPAHRFRELPRDLFAGKILIDAMNYWEPVDGVDDELAAAAAGTSTVVQERFPSARVVKSLNQLGYHEVDELRRPNGGYRENRAASRASSASSTVGTMMPIAPRSVAFWMLASSASGMRIMGAAPTPGQVSIMRRTSSNDIVLCCISNQM